MFPARGNVNLARIVPPVCATLLLAAALVACGKSTAIPLATSAKGGATVWGNPHGDSTHSRRVEAIGPAFANVAWRYDMDVQPDKVLFSDDGWTYCSSGKQVLAFDSSGN